MDPAKKIAISKKIEKKKRKNKKCRCCDGEIEGCDSRTRRKCTTPYCDIVLPLCIAILHAGKCINCDMIIGFRGQDVVEKIGHSNFCQYCFKSLVPIGDRRKNGAPHKDWDSRQYHKKCWIEHIRDN